MLTITIGFALLTPSPEWAAPSHQDPTPAAAPAADEGREELQEILDEYQDAYDEFLAAYKAAAEADRNKIYEEQYPDAEDYVPRLLAVAESHPKTAVALEALAWVLARSQGESQQKALTALIADHFTSEKMAEVCFSFPDDEAGKALLVRLVAESPHVAVRGSACYALATRVGPPYDPSEPWTTKDEYVVLMRRIQAEFPDVDMRGAKLGDLARGGLFEVERLQIGMDVPEIAGEDIAGVPFKLSDYQGKVVMLDFWGHW